MKILSCEALLEFNLTERIRIGRDKVNVDALHPWCSPEHLNEGSAKACRVAGRICSSNIGSYISDYLLLVCKNDLRQGTLCTHLPIVNIKIKSQELYSHIIPEEMFQGFSSEN